MFCFWGCIWIVWLCVCVLYSSSWMVELCYMNVITGQIFFYYIRHLTKDLSKGRWPLGSNCLHLLSNTGSFPSLLLCFSSLIFYFFLIPLSFTPPLLVVCQLLTNHPFVQRKQWHLEHVSISSCYGKWIQICGTVCLMSANMNENV